MQNTDKIVVAKPVPSRPYSRFSSFSELLAGTIHASPPPATSETVVAIRPKTVRFKPSKNQSLHKVIPCPQSDLSESIAYCACDEDSRCKPDAKLLPENPAALMENVGNDYSHLPHKVPNKMSQFQLTNQEKSVPQNMEQDTKCQHIITNNVDRPCYDGYSWRKYGQKQVKGSNHPRSYYKCTYPTCPMKKKVEKSFDGKIAEIVYEGEHNHPKPQPPKRLIPGSEVQNFAPQGGSMSTNGGSDQINYGGVGLGKVLHNSHGTLLNATYNQGGNLDISSGLCGDDVGSTENEERSSKRRKNKEQVGGEEHILSHATVAQHGGGSLLQSSIEPHVLGDGFRWRKYGQKAVKGNSYPRSYYKCTNLKCTVRKHVERAADDPSSFITTYEGKHNHQMPDTKTNSASASDTDMY